MNIVNDSSSALNPHSPQYLAKNMELLRHGWSIRLVKGAP